MSKESRQKEKETQELKQKLAEARKVRFETESKFQEMMSSYDDTDLIKYAKRLIYILSRITSLHRNPLKFFK